MPTGGVYTLTWSNFNYSGYILGVINLNPGGHCGSQSTSSTGSQSELVITQITLPNGKFYRLSYDSTYGTLKEITYPNGGYARYTYAVEPSYGRVVSSDQFGTCSSNIERVMVSTREVGFVNPSTGNDASPIETQTFAYSDTSNNAPENTGLTTTDNVRNISAEIDYIYDVSTGGVASPSERTVVYKDSTGAVLKTVNKSWFDQYSLSCEVATIGAAGPSRGTIYGYAQGDVLIDKREYDYGQISPSACTSASWLPGYGLVALPSGTPARETVYTLQSFGTTNYAYAPSLLDRPCKVVVNDGSGNPSSETDSLYDGGTNVCGSPGTPSTASVTNLPPGTHDETLYGPSASTSRGNNTSVTRKCFGCTDSTTQYAYDETGQVWKVTDPKSNITLIDHTDSPAGSYNTNAYVTKIDPPHVNNLSHATTFSYDYHTGNLLSATDPNGQPTTYTYSDPLHRLTHINYPGGGETGYCYTDVGGSYPGGTCTNNTANFQVFAGTIATPDPTVTSYTTYDGLGNAVETGITSAPGTAGPIITRVTYDGLNQVKDVTNPYQGTSTGSVSYAYDALGRKILQTQQDGTSIRWCYDGISNAAWSSCTSNQSSNANASWVNSQDESGNVSQQVTDGLGRLSAVMEQLPSGSSLGLETNYTYNALDDLLQVNQKGITSSETARTRRFGYDSLSRLTFACNPESLSPGQTCDGTHWSNQYSYDPSSNLQYKTDARGVTVNYFYDSLNRLSAKTYSTAGSLSSCYTYDSASNNGVGRLKAEWTTPSSCSTTSGYQSMRTFLAYDPMGRVLNEQQCVLSNCTTGTSTPSCQTGSASGISYCYNLAGKLHSLSSGLSAPSALTFTSLYDSAGRLSSLTSNWNDSSHPPNLFTADPAAGYTPSGQIQNFSLGSHIGVTKTYDNRLRSTGETATNQ